jgi:two-component system sensor histidine kinase DctS
MKVGTFAHPGSAAPPRALPAGLWALPMAVSLLFVIGVAAWLHAAEQRARDAQRQELISDALSLEAQLSARIEVEQQQLHTLAAAAPSPAAFAYDSHVTAGLRRAWLSVTWLDAANRIVAEAPGEPQRAGGGLSAHLSAPLPQGGTLVARYSPAALMRGTVPWWLARKYDVRLVDAYDTVITSTAERPRSPEQAWHRVSLEPQLGNAFLELTARDVITPWTRSLPTAMALAFLAVVAAATWMLRRQIRGVQRAEERWRGEAAWRRAMEDSLNVGLRARDLEGRLVYANRAFADIVGWAPHELLGLLPPMPYWPPDTLDETMSRHRRSTAGEAPRAGYEARWRRRDGRPVDVVVFEAPLVDAHGHHVGWMASVLDNTERKRLEDNEQRRSEAMAHHARLTMLGEIASALAHELNQPLTAIASFNAGVINSLRKQPTPDPVVLSALQRMGEQAEHAGRIVQRIREFLTRRTPRPERCELHDVVGEAVGLMHRVIDRAQVQLVLDLAPALAPVRGDPVLIEQVVINLVRNACDALAAQTGERRVRIATSTAGQRFVRVCVQDNGPGLEGRTIDMLCAPFYSTKNDGMGIGLAICRSILEAHKGALDAAPAPGGGALFTFTLPVWRVEDDMAGVDSDTSPHDAEVS